MALWKILQIVNNAGTEDPYKLIRQIVGETLWPGSDSCEECDGIGQVPAVEYPVLLTCEECYGTGRKQESGVEPAAPPSRAP